MKRQVFYSFHYGNDCWRTQTIRNIGLIDGSRPVSGNDWESVKRGGRAAIERWIDEQLKYRSCTIVLVGSNTHEREWVRHEIERSWMLGKGVLGIHVHGLLNQDGRRGIKGANPFDHFTLGNTPMSSIVKCYDPPHFYSKDVYAHVASNIEGWVEEAIRIRNMY